ncbi:MAG: hypothetical protein ACKOC5_16655, partial [Chloroflexota bacterium]
SSFHFSTTGSLVLKVRRTPDKIYRKSLAQSKKTFTATVKAYCQQLSASERPYVVMDSAGFSAATLKTAQEQDVYWLMRAPETLAQAKQMVKDTLEAEQSEIEPGYQSVGEEEGCAHPQALEAQVGPVFQQQ